MIKGVDSSGFWPSPTQVQAAYQQGVRVWGGYLPGPGIYSGHTKAFFDNLRAGGMRTIAYCSGNADPGQQKALGAAWGVDYICLDVEGGIRGDGPWVQAWLDASGAGLYGNPPVFNGRRAPFFIMADYLGSYPNYTDPNDTWLGTPPSVPHGWQWAGSVDAYGGGVDLCWLDDWFAQGEDMTPEESQTLVNTYNATQFIVNDPIVGLIQVQKDLDALKKQIAALQPGGGGGGLTPAQQDQLNDIQGRIDKALQP